MPVQFCKPNFFSQKNTRGCVTNFVNFYRWKRTSRTSSNMKGIRCLTRCFSQQVCRLQTQTATNAISEPDPVSQLSEKRPLIDPLKYHDYFGVRKLVNMEELFKARVHLGHKEGTLNPKMTPFIYGSRLGHLIFDLDQTAELLSDALNFVAHIAYRNGIILFVSHYPQHTMLVEDTAKKCGEFAFAREWRINIFTNAENIYQGVTRLPDLCILLSTLDPLMRNHLAVLDCAKMAIPTVGIVDTNSDPNLITYPVPGNDDSPSAVQLYCRLFSEAILAGKSKRKEHGLS